MVAKGGRGHPKEQIMTINCHNSGSAEWLNKELEAKQIWLDYVATNGIPDGIPERPDQVYSEWQGWQDWLGWTSNNSDSRFTQRN